ncbi:hypothetical protein DRJ25_04695, partial [Candidatus Woesearchaeota archaeon]
MITKAKMLNYLIIVGVLMSVVPCAVAAMDGTGTGDYTKILDKERRLAIAEATSTAHLKNDVLDLYFTEQNSNLWQYQWQPGQWGESCYHEHFGVYTDDAGRTLESEEFTIDQPFANPGGVPGTVTALLHYGDVQVKRKITLISGDIRFFEIEYTIKNTGASTLNDVRFFQTIDFDIPWTSDCTDDHAWYDAEHDYVIVRDDDYDFENSFKAMRHSTRHGVDYWRTEIYDDWDDGNLNNANSYGPGDPGIGMQYNLGNLAVGEEEIVTITVWSGEPTEEVKPKFSDDIEFGNNKGNHHTKDYPREYNTKQCNVLRRGQSFDLNANIENFDYSNHKIIFEITKPNGETQKLPPARKDGILGDGWDCRYERVWDWFNPNKFNFEIHIPGSEQIGKYQLVGKIQKKDGDITYDVYGVPADDCHDGDEAAPEFYVIFNPWSSEDEDVFYPEELKHELDFFATGDDGRQYIPVVDKYDITLFYRITPWTLNPGDKEIFDTAMEKISKETSAFTATEKIRNLTINNAGYNGHKRFERFEYSLAGYTLPSDYGDLEEIDSFDTSEILPGYWFDRIDPKTGKTYDGYDRASYGNVPNIIHDWKKDKKQYGQCHSFGAISTSLLRSVGIPSKMVTTIDGKHAQEPAWSHWNYHVWIEIWDGRSSDNDKWNAVATTEQMGPSSRNAPVFKTMTQSIWDGETGLPRDDYVKNIFTDNVTPHWLWFWSWNLERENIAELYTTPQQDMMGFSVATSDDQLEIGVSTNKSEYALGEDVLININVTNNNDAQITHNLTTAITGISSGYLMDYRFLDTKEVSVPPHSTIDVVYILRQEDYVINRHYTVLSHINETTGGTTFIINSGLNLTATLPETVLINESFDVMLETKNTLDTSIANIEIQADFPYYANVADTPTNFTIPILAPGATNTTTWVVSIPDDGYQSVTFSARSVGYGCEEIIAGTEVSSNPFLRVDVEVPPSVQKDSTFAVNVTIVNEGDLAAGDVQSELTLPPELTTSDDLIKPIGTIDPHANTTIVWNIAADEAGTSAFTIITDSSTTSGEDVIFIPIFIYDHDLEVSVEESQIEADGDLHIINMTIHNLGNVEDSVLLQYLVTDPDISFSIYDGDERIIAQPVTVPANGDKILNLKIMPEYETTGTITIHATSELDPTASDSANVEVSSISPIILDIADVTAQSSHTATVPIIINGMTNFGAATVTLSYDPAVVQITSITAGDLGTP